MMRRATAVIRHVALSVLIIALTGVATIAQQEGAETTMTLDQLREARRELAFAPRGILANNDGCDALYFPKDEEVTVENFLDMRTTALADDDSQVGAISYCSISSGFSFFTHDTEVGTVLTRQPQDFGLRPDAINATQALIDLGSDCLKSVVDFGHENDIEVYWSMRMNDTHDVSHSPDNPYLLYPPLKEEHPEWLVGAHDDRTPFGRWSSVDYAVEEIRDLAFSYIEEVCRNYDVDGIELDFFRHLCYFESVARGGVATDEEREMMTDLMRRIRAMTEEVGLERGRPILISMRLPDSLEFCRDMGFDIETWLDEGLLDILITSGYFRLNPWEYTVELAHEHGVAAYPCLTDSRVKGESRFRRRSLESYRGRAMNVWAAGADGVHTFNFFNPNSPVLREIGDPQVMATMDKLYFASIVDGSPERWLADSAKYRQIPVLTPSEAMTINPEEPLTVELPIGEDFEAARAAGGEPTVMLHLEIPGLANPEQLQVALNGHPLEGGTVEDSWLDCPVDPDWINRGANTVEIAVNPDAHADEDRWTIEWEATEEPGSPWFRDRGSARTEARLEDDALLVADRGTEGGDYMHYRYAWGASPGENTVVEAEAKVISGSSFLIVSNGPAQERLTLWPDRIQLHHHQDISYEMDTTDDFHTYRVVTEGEDLQVFVDGELVIDAPGTYTGSGSGARQLSFGAANSPMLGEALWRSVRARLRSQSCRDLLVSVSYD
ncbi:MAG: hypothetical protein ACLFU7_10015 [Armatimonadota bacterium]